MLPLYCDSELLAAVVPDSRTLSFSGGIKEGRDRRHKAKDGGMQTRELLQNS
uniref:Uncharacterized protein n=1 Tax=Anguilla anguilla TaxID=7936 RepID=A0A0E9W3C0_ANGAN